MNLILLIGGLGILGRFMYLCTVKGDSDFQKWSLKFVTYFLLAIVAWFIGVNGIVLMSLEQPQPTWSGKVIKVPVEYCK